MRLNLDSYDAWLRRLEVYLKSEPPRINTKVGEIYEIDFGVNPGAEFSGRHLALCLSSTRPSEERLLVVPLTSKISKYNISKEDVITCVSNNGKEIIGGVVLGEAKWVSKIRLFKQSTILKETYEESEETSYSKARVKISAAQFKRWKSL